MDVQETLVAGPSNMEPSLTETPNLEPPTETPSDLRRRIAALEIDLQEAQVAKESAEVELAAQAKHSAHAHHAARNLELYGHDDGIIFVEPEDRDQGLICRLARGEGTGASVCRFMVRYNIDQLLQRPVLHQWLQNGKLYREAGEQQSSRFELFFDLLFVGMVHQISEAAAEEPTGTGFARYFLTFAPAFSIWGDVRDIANQYANDDVTQRLYILWIMMLLVGYANNASSIQFGEAEAGSEVLSEESLTSMRWTLGFFVVAKLSKVALSVIYALFLPMSRRPLLVSTLNSLVLTLIFFIAIFTSLHVAIGLVALGILTDHVLRIAGVLLFKTMEGLGKKYERRRQRHYRQKLARQNSRPWSPADDAVMTPGVEKRTPEAELSGPFEGIRTGNSSSTAINEEAPLGDLKVCQDAAAHESYRFPATNIEHHVERLGAFVIVVLGEMVVSVFFNASGTVGLNLESGRALLGLMIAFNLNWLYFGSQACKHFVHAIRRHWFTGFVFTSLHLPLCMALLLASSAIGRLVTSAAPDSPLGGGLKWFFGAGLGVSVWTMATIGLLHRNLDDQAGYTERRTGRIRRTISRRVVLGTRYAAGLAMVLVPLVDGLSSVQFLAIYVGITAFLVFEETIALIERREMDLDLDDRIDSAEEVI
ncbi:hypothetical protein B0H17DRAFT_1039152 [Mycena rosella]|uniref:Uncharacterized protein n=1 Tax=Mycena rosella TaxID=1033263 RepID=A0AAD7M758_MYCRO|nr:hypothetical protein B0H17DRAFT_1039152 [Mycena rosella]